MHPRFGEMNRPSVGQEVGAVRVAPCEGVRLPERASPEGEVVVVDAGPADRLDLDWLLQYRPRSAIGASESVEQGVDRGLLRCELVLQVRPAGQVPVAVGSATR